MAFVLGLASVPSAWAVPLFFTGFDGVDASSGSGRDSLELRRTTSGGKCGMAATTKCTSNGGPWPCCTGSGTGNCEHNANSGGATSSLWSFIADPTGSGQTCFYGLNTSVVAFARAQLAAGFNLRVATPPSTARTIYKVMEDTNGDGVGDQIGCFLKLNPDRTLSVYYRTTGTLFGASGEKVLAQSCGAGNGLPADPLTPCTVASDCASGVCASCAPAGGAGCFWGGIELIQTNAPSTSGDRVFCDLWFNGRHTVNAGSKPVPSGVLSIIVDARLGFSDTEASTAEVYLDDYMLDDSTRAHYGYVESGFPAGDGSTSQWTGSCPGGHYLCVNDYQASGYDTLTLGSAKPSRSLQFYPLTTINPGTLKVAAVNSELIGRTGTVVGTHEISHRVLLCSSPSTCSAASAPHVFTLAVDPTDRLLDAYIQTANPAGSSWLAATFPSVAVEVGTTPNHCGTSSCTSRLGALVLYARVERADAPLPITLKDHNLGKSCTCTTDSECGVGAALGDCHNGKCGQINARSTCTQNADCAAGRSCTPDDGLVTVYGVGDSTAGGTVSVTCQGGTNAGGPCSQSDYCGQISTLDLPVGGCGGINAVCQTCTNRRAEFNRGAGYACGPNNGGQTCALGTCSAVCDTGVGNCCAGDTTVTCANDAACNLGLCDTCDTAACTGGSNNTPTDVCVTSCPGGGVCPSSRSFWPDALEGKIGFDILVNCGKGLEPTGPAGLRARWPTIVAGREPSCRAVVGHGRCSCVTGVDCGTAGVCSSGVCTSGDAKRTNCLETLSGTGGVVCATGQVCVLPAPDVVVVDEGVNDMALGVHNPNCSGPSSLGQLAVGSLCDWCNTSDPNRGPYCATNANCTGAPGYPSDSACYGRQRGSWTIGCTQDFVSQLFLSAFCLEHAVPCRTTADCPLGQSCDGGSAADLRAQGVCTCASNAQCASTDRCVGTAGHKVCRVACATDVDCGTGTPAGGCVTTNPPDADAAGTKVCGGRCSCPSDARSCTSDRDCFGGTIITLIGAAVFRGTCVNNVCACTGSNVCENEPTCRAQHAAEHARHGHFLALDNFAWMLAYIAGQSDPTPPVVAFGTLPQLNCRPCDSPWSDDGYTDKVSLHLLADIAHFPRVIDLRAAFAPVLWKTGRTDAVHLNPIGAEGFAQEMSLVLNAWNVCATGSRATARAAPYCKSTATGTFTSTPCSSTGDCALGQLCLPRPCATNGDCPSGTGDTCHGDL